VSSGSLDVIVLTPGQEHPIGGMSARSPQRAAMHKHTGRLIALWVMTRNYQAAPTARSPLDNGTLLRRYRGRGLESGSDIGRPGSGVRCAMGGAAAWAECFLRCVAVTSWSELWRHGAEKVRASSAGSRHSRNPGLITRWFEGHDAGEPVARDVSPLWRTLTVRVPSCDARHIRRWTDRRPGSIVADASFDLLMDSLLSWGGCAEQSFYLW
jgi:hypothetical protein